MKESIPPILCKHQSPLSSFGCFPSIARSAHTYTQHFFKPSKAISNHMANWFGSIPVQRRREEPTRSGCRWQESPEGLTSSRGRALKPQGTPGHDRYCQKPATSTTPSQLLVPVKLQQMETEALGPSYPLVTDKT